MAKRNSPVTVFPPVHLGRRDHGCSLKPGTRHYHPAVSPDGKWILFGSDRSGIMQLYVATTDGKESWPITNVPAGSCAMHGHWQPITAPKPNDPEKSLPDAANGDER